MRMTTLLTAEKLYWVASEPVVTGDMVLGVVSLSRDTGEAYPLGHVVPGVSSHLTWTEPSMVEGLLA